MNLNFYVQSRFLQMHSCLLQNLVLKATYLHYSMVMEYIAGLLVDFGQNPVSTFLLSIVVETMAHSWAISNTLANQTFAPTWEKLVVLH